MNKTKVIAYQSIRTLLKSALAWLVIAFLPLVAVAQDRLETPIRLKIEDGNTEQVSVVLKNLTTGETNSVLGEAKFSLSLKLNCDYIISFSKPGYVTKKIQVNTQISAERARQGLYPFPFDVYLFKQYDGVNIIVFNQPVGKISYNKDMDEFDYDTDYTKQIQSQIREAEEQTRQKALAEQQKNKELEKEQAALKAKADQEARELAKQQEAEKKKALAEARDAEAQQKKAEKLAYIEKQKELKAQADADKKARLEAQAAEEQKRKLEAKAAAEAAAQQKAAVAQERPVAARSGAIAEETQPAGKPGASEEQLVVVSQVASQEDPGPPDGYRGSGSDERIISKAAANSFQETGPQKARPYVFQDAAAPTTTRAVRPAMATAASTDVMGLPEIKVEEISEINRVITRVTVRQSAAAVVYRRVAYQWGGVYFFRNDRPISESLFLMATAQR